MSTIIEGSRDLSGTLVTPNRRASFQLLALPQHRPEGLIFDVDGTLYNNDAYRIDVARREAEAVASAKGWPVNQAAGLLGEHRQRLSENLGRPARVTETVLSLGLTTDWWNRTREEVYHPEDFLQPDPNIDDLIDTALSRGLRVGIATNSPAATAQRILEILGVNDVARRRVLVAGADTLGASKPDHNFFLEAAQQLGTNPESVVSFGDDTQNDIDPAIEAGMGAVLIPSVDQLKPAMKLVVEQPYEPIDLNKVVSSQYEKGKTTILGLTGRAGAGKSTTAAALADACASMGIPANVLSLDAFFILSSAGRKAWLEEGKSLGPDEYAFRSDQKNWWDFDRASGALSTLKRGQPLVLENVYNRADKGELTGRIEITPPSEGMIVVFEGVATPHLGNGSGLIDHIMYVSAHPKERRERLLGRDGHRSGSAALERFHLTQNFEGRYFSEYGHLVNTVIDNSNQQLKLLSAISAL